MRQFRRSHVVTIATFAAAALASVAAPAAQLTFSGRLSAIVVDTGGAVFSGAVIGQLFEGGATYGDSAADASGIHTEPGEANYEFPAALYGGSVTSGAVTEPGTNINVNIQDDHALDADEAALVSALAGGPIAEGTLVDVWSLIGFSPGAFEQDPDPGDGDDTQLLFNGGRVEVTFLSFDSGLYANTDYRALPPALGAGVLGAFFIEEADVDGNTLLLAYGPLESVATVVPLPATLAMVAPALAVLAARRRDRR
jgi:pyruvate/2-oxoglutarate dehydrogenase complex dihydrolipoamide acyltransferase (E2) component